MVNDKPPERNKVLLEGLEEFRISFNPNNFQAKLGIVARLLTGVGPNVEHAANRLPTLPQRPLQYLAHNIPP